jgi:hypothetical protein
MIAFIIGGIIGMFIIVRLFLLLAGVAFTHWRQVLTAYLAAAIAATFIVATGGANGGPPNFTAVPNQWFGALVAAALEIGLLYRRRAAKHQDVLEKK